MFKHAILTIADDTGPSKVVIFHTKTITKWNIKKGKEFILHCIFNHFDIKHLET